MHRSDEYNERDKSMKNNVQALLMIERRKELEKY